MNPSNRLAIRVVHMMRSMYRRSTAIVACLMSESLDVCGSYMPTKVSVILNVVRICNIICCFGKT